MKRTLDDGGQPDRRNQDLADRRKDDAYWNRKKSNNSRGFYIFLGVILLGFGLMLGLMIK
ncbi:MAG: hypothetical protein Q9M26_04140 [Mariprofundales bacterium]|nr:hypothetical protein [Mariprofundales bacterium]